MNSSTSVSRSLTGSIRTVAVTDPPSSNCSTGSSSLTLGTLMSRTETATDAVAPGRPMVCPSPSTLNGSLSTGSNRPRMCTIWWPSTTSSVSGWTQKSSDIWPGAMMTTSGTSSSVPSETSPSSSSTSRKTANGSPRSPRRETVMRKGSPSS